MDAPHPAGSTRRTFIRDVAVAGTSTAAALYGLDEAGVADLVADAAAADAQAPLSEFAALAASSEDAFGVPEGFAWQVVIGWGDEFENTDGSTYVYGFNNDYLAYFPLKGSDEGLLFVNHEYPDPFYQHGFKPLSNGSPRPGGKATKSIADIDAEKEAVGNSIVHVRRLGDGRWQVVSPSPYNRRVYGGRLSDGRRTPLTFTGPLAKAGAAGSSAPDPRVHGPNNEAEGTVGNCSGGITPWNTALSCEENYDGYGMTFNGSNNDFTYGWDHLDPTRPRTEQQAGLPSAQAPGDPEYFARTAHPSETRKYGWVCEHDPYDAKGVGRKHTALGRFRHENTAFRVAKGKKFVLYMGDDATNQGIYKFVSTRQYNPFDRREDHLKILTEGTLHIARFAPEGRRRFAAANGQGGVVSPSSGTGTWEPIDVSDLFDTRLRLAGFTTDTSPGRRPRQRTSAGNTDPGDNATYAGRYNRLIDDEGTVYLGDDPAPAGYYNEWERHFATNRPEDIEVAPDGSVYVALTNNTSGSGLTTEPNANDPFGSIRRIVEQGNDPEATTFTWDEYAAGGDRGGAEGERGYASPDNLHFDSEGGIWVVTDISSSSLNGNNAYAFHKNNAVFYLPRGEQTAYRFANMPLQAEATGPYFTPDESTLFINVQHPGEEAKSSSTSVFGDAGTYSSYWPDGNKTKGQKPSTPTPSTVAIFRPRGNAGGTPGGGQVPTPGQAATPAPPAPAPGTDLLPPAVKVTAAPRTMKLATLRRSGVKLTIEVDEPALLEVRLTGRVRYRSGNRRRTLAATTLGTAKANVRSPGKVSVTVKPSLLSRTFLARPGADVLGERVVIEATDRAGNVRRSSRALNVKR